MCSLKCYREDFKYYFCSVVYQEQQNVKVRRRVNLSVHLKDGQLSLISTNKELTFSSIFKNETKYFEFIIISGILNINVSTPNLGLEIITLKSKLEDLQLPKFLKILEFVITTV